MSGLPIVPNTFFECFTNSQASVLLVRDNLPLSDGISEFIMRAANYLSTLVPRLVLNTPSDVGSENIRITLHQMIEDRYSTMATGHPFMNVGNPLRDIT